MKRAAAIIGPTPSFVRWAIRYDCEFRQTDTDNLPYETFRQLRSIRELSNGYQQKRVIDGFCIHTELNVETSTARGFPAAEVYDLYGNREQIEKTCGACPANAASFSDDRAESWAGCFGWFFSTSHDANWIELFDAVNIPENSNLANSKRLWFGVWQVKEWDQKNLSWLQDILEQTLAACPDHEVRRFQLAVENCIEHQLVLETELVPRGHSDGLKWTVEPCCSICHCEIEPDSKTCEECGHVGVPLPARKRKVLGLRPYMLLKHLIGELETQRLLDDFHTRRTEIQTND